MAKRELQVQWVKRTSTSKHQFADGYYILRDGNSKRIKGVGVKGDTLGYCVSKWLRASEFWQRVQGLQAENDSQQQKTNSNANFKGLLRCDDGLVLNGACGLKHIMRIAWAVGVTLTTEYQPQKVGEWRICKIIVNYD